MDNFMKKIPGTPGTKVFLITTAIVGGSYLYVFGEKADADGSGKQGQHYFSSERPEVIQAGQENQRRLEREEKEQKE
jgi:hypothetical protein